MAEGKSDDNFFGENASKVIIYKINKPTNIAQIVRSSIAFGVNEVILVREKECNASPLRNKTKKLVRIKWNEVSIEYLNSVWGSSIHFVGCSNLKDCQAYLKGDGYTIFGVEIGENSLDVTTHPFSQRSAFLFGRETGLEAEAAQICDKTVFIPQYSRGIGSLNVCVAASILVYNFAVWAKFEPVSCTGQKFAGAEEDLGD
jgi:tRNA G18 (ribose-2'-O)-methylase SpoU